MSEQRRQQIEAKKAKLEAMRAARQQRKPRTSGAAETPPEIGRDKEKEKEDLQRILNELAPPSSGHGTPYPGSESPSRSQASPAPFERTSPRPSAGTDPVIERELTPRYLPDLIDIHQDLFELPQKTRTLYEKEIQTVQVETETEESVEDKIREQLIMQQHLEAERIAYEKAQEEELAKLDREIEEEVRELTEEERVAFLADPEVQNFIDDSTKIFHRVLNDRYNYMSDYTQGTETGGSDDSEGRRVKRVCEFWSERYGKNRSITDVDWSPKFPELTVASYNKNHAALNEPAGIVAVWNTHSVERPEFVFHSQSDVLSVMFSPFHSNLIFGGTYSGQILLWDNRSKHLPVLKTPLSAAGHTHPVYAIQMVGTQNAHNLITSSTDGTVCSWLVDMLAQPQETLELIHAGHNKTGEVAITALDFPNNETTTFWVGTEEGNVYQANRYDRAGAKAGLNQYDVYKGHSGPVMGLHFHPLAGPVDFSDLFLTCSVDWTVKLWRAKSLAKPSTSPHAISPLYSFDEADDYVYDVKWHPQHPALFGTVDGSGKFDLWNLNTDTEVPVVSTSVGSGRALNKLQWNKDGRHAALGGSDGRLYVYDIGDMGTSRESEWQELSKVVAGIKENGVETGR
ncbi:WD-REPEATS-REGION domain-containing protein [Mycena venus]|uniref:WD-REPEATS-REGION domain-containing protein n=1 Tax=Mycena venus TaxID=2733690 RepID=A0A8H6YEH6_9AGAR|nr:WD-REPEATS-REGION domain-containing protein [Mycena venus]